MAYVLGDFNTKSKSWYKIDTNSLEIFMTDAVTSNYGLLQLIQEITHILDLPYSCVDVIFTPRPSFVKETGVRYKKMKTTLNKLRDVHNLYEIKHLT